MLVGDPKQSIYRWRGGKAEQFIALSKDKNPFVNPDKKLFSLGTNWRSYSEIIDFNNDFFGFMAAEFDHEDYKDLYKNHSHQQQNDIRHHPTTGNGIVRGRHAPSRRNYHPDNRTGRMRR